MARNYYIIILLYITIYIYSSTLEKKTLTDVIREKQVASS